MGSIEPRGPATIALRLVDPQTSAMEGSIFDGIDVSVSGLAALAGLPPGALRAELTAIDAATTEARRSYQPLNPSGLVPALAGGLRAARAARKALASMTPSNATADADFLLAHKEEEFSTALTRAAGIVVDPLADDETVQPGGTTVVAVRTFEANPALVQVTSATVRAPDGWTVAPASAGARGNNPVGRREVPSHSASYRVTLPADAAPTQPYFLAAPRNGDMYRWPDEAPKGLPFAKALLTAVVDLEIAGTPVTVRQPVQYRYADPVRGELRREVNVVPALTVTLDSPLLIVPTGAAPHSQRLVARATSFSAQPMNGAVRLRLPAGWTATPADSPFSLAARGDTVSAAFVVTAPARRLPGRQVINVEASSGGATFVSQVQIVAYPHIQTHRLYSAAAAAVHVLDLKVASVRVGYIMGSGDQVPDALRRMGVDVTMLDDETIASGDLSHFDTIVVGIRASEARPAFVAHQTRAAPVHGARWNADRAVSTAGIRRAKPPALPGAGSGQFACDGRDGARAASSRRHIPCSLSRIASPLRISTDGCRNGTSTRSLDSMRGTRRCSSRPIRRTAAAWGRGLRGRGQGPLRVYRLRLVPSAPGRRARRVPAVRESHQPSAGAEVTRDV